MPTAGRLARPRAAPPDRPASARGPTRRPGCRTVRDVFRFDSCLPNGGLQISRSTTRGAPEGRAVPLLRLDAAPPAQVLPGAEHPRSRRCRRPVRTSRMRRCSHRASASAKSYRPRTMGPTPSSPARCRPVVPSPPPRWVANWRPRGRSCKCGAAWWIALSRNPHTATLPVMPSQISSQAFSSSAAPSWPARARQPVGHRVERVHPPEAVLALHLADEVEGRLAFRLGPHGMMEAEKVGPVHLLGRPPLDGLQVAGLVRERVRPPTQEEHVFGGAEGEHVRRNVVQSGNDAAAVGAFSPRRAGRG